MVSDTLKNAVRPLIVSLNRPFAATRFRRIVARTRGPLKINVGASTSRLPDGWIGTDIGPRARFYLDATKTWPIPPNTVDRVYADNMIEHIDITQARKMLRHTLCALVPGGKIRLVTPDVERIARIYLDDESARAKVIERHIRHGYKMSHSVDLLRVVFNCSGHHLGYLWDYASLSAEMSEAGFQEIVRCEIGESTDPVFRGLEQRSTLIEGAIQLVVEAMKPRA